MSGNPSEPLDIIGNFRFIVELDGVFAGGFSEISGLEAETEYEEYQEGGVNQFTYRFPKATKFPPLVLKRGISTSNSLWEWFEHTMTGSIKRKTGSIIMYNHQGDEVCRWSFEDAYPIKWSGPNLASISNEVAIESIEIVHNGLKAKYGKEDRSKNGKGDNSK